MDMWMDVDAALAEVPINVMPLIDDTDFKTVEDSLTYDQAGMDLRWNFVTTAGAMTSTPVTPTTGGVHDWTNQGDGLYTLEIPASGGTVDNDTEGFGWFSGKITGVLPFRGPVIGFRAAGLNDLMIDSAYSVTRGLVGTALPAAAADAAGGIPISDAGELDLDNMCNNALVALKLDHLLAVADADDVVDNSVIAKLADRAFGTADWSNFDNTMDSLRAIRDRGDQAWLTGVGSEGTESYVTTSWARTVGDNDGGVGSDTATVDGSYFSTGETGAGTYLEVDAVFATSAGQQGRTLNMWGFYSGGGNHYIEIKAYNYTDSTWEPIGIIGSDTVVAKHSFNLTPDQTKADGEISIKFLHGGGSGVVSHVLSIDKCEVNTSIPSTGDVNITQWDGNAVTGDGDWAELQGDVDLLNITVQAMSVTLDSVDGKVDTLDTVADAIKAKTDNLPQGIKKNTAYPDFLFTMVDSTDSVTPKTGLTVTAKRNIDGAGFLACANAVVEVADGWYIIDLADTDLNGDSIALQFTASGAGMTTFTLKTET